MLSNHTLRIYGAVKIFFTHTQNFSLVATKGIADSSHPLQGLHQPIHQREIIHGDLLTVDEVVWPSRSASFSSNTTRHTLCWSLGATAPVLVYYWDKKACES